MKEKYIAYIIISLFLVGCSTSKNTWLSRGYHNLTAKYNVLFNGQQSYEKGIADMRQSLKNDYTDILPMFVFSEESQVDVASSQMERAIAKGHKLIREHSITVKPRREPSGRNPEYRKFYNQKEFNRWVDDAWMLIGKAHLSKQEYYEAARAFDKVIRTFPAKQVRFEAMLWLARTYIEMDDYENARRYLERFSSEEREKDFNGLYASTYAWFWLSRDQYQEALDYCRQAIKNSGDRWHKVRWSYVLGQVAERTGDRELALRAYQDVIQMNPDYAFRLHAMVKSALLAGGPENPELSRRQLKGYAGEFKNRDYRDQIYYAVAQTWFWEEDTLSGLTNLQLAAGYGGENRALQGEVYREMAQIYFQSNDYIAANAYYDSTLTVLPENYQGIETVRQKKRKIGPLAQSLQLAEHEDSVQRIAAWPEAKRDQFLNDLVARMKQEEEAQRMGATTGGGSFYRNFSSQRQRRGAGGGSNQWYFYNQTMVSLGKMEFEKRWGRRSLEDNWRRSGKDAQSQPGGGSQGQDGMMPSDPFNQGQPPGSAQQGQSPGQQSGSRTDVPDRETLLEGLPLSKEEMLASHQRKQQAMFNAASTLSHNFGKYREAVNMFEELLKQYPQNPYRQQILVGIYMACRKMGESSCVNHYGQVILDDYPDNRIARFVRNPELFENQDRIRQQMNDLYQSAYLDVRNNSWDSVLQKTRKILKSSHEELMPQALLLNALANSQQENPKLFQSRLENLVKNFGNSAQADVANHWLSLVEQGKQPSAIDFSVPSERSMAQASETREDSISTASESPERSLFQMAPDSAHYVMTVLPNEANVDQLMFHLANFNFDRYTRQWLDLEIRNIGDTLRVLETGPFQNSQAGLTYFYSLLDNPSVFRVDKAGEPLVLVISDDNREKLTSAQRLITYKEFFLENYLPESSPSAIVISQSELPEAGYMEVREPESQSVFSPNQGEVWGLLVLRGEGGDVDEARSFLPGVTRSSLRYRIRVEEENLPGGQNVLLLKTFDERADYDELASSLEDNSYYQSRVAGEEWIMCPVTEENFQKLMNEEGSLSDYLEFLGF